MVISDVLVIGGGVIGLSIAWELARRGKRVKLIDQGKLAREASWAGAGILPPAARPLAIHPYDQLRAMAFEMHRDWSARLLADTGIHNGYRQTGALYLARSAGESASLIAWSHLASDEQIQIEKLSRERIKEVEPQLDPAPGGQPLRAAYYLPEECQIRNPRHLQALIRACVDCGVELIEDAKLIDLEIEHDEVTAAVTSQGNFSAHHYCFATGAWSGALLQKLGFEIGVLPIRGQMLLLKTDAPILRTIVNEGPRYLVPRDDGHLLVGATEEEVGFDKRTTAEGLADLHQFAIELVPALESASVVQSWAGLRPASYDGFPYLGKLPNLANALIAAGHFRSGLYLSPATACVISDLIAGDQPAIDLTPFCVIR